MTKSKSKKNSKPTGVGNKQDQGGVMDEVVDEVGEGGIDRLNVEKQLNRKWRTTYQRHRIKKPLLKMVTHHLILIQLRLMCREICIINEMDLTLQ